MLYSRSLLIINFKYSIMYIYTTEYYSAVEKNEIMPFAATRTDLGTVILSEVRQRRRNTV